ncbi:unnamed protein product [Peniophora sp. CBMAI 1063]|nr:unnamed protein product [Peniophora sp. CBMAI 1063]
MLDDMDGSTRVDALGVPVTSEYEASNPAGDRTSQGKTQVDYLTQFKERNLGPKYAHLVITFRHAPPPGLRCHRCQKADVARWRCAHCMVKRDFCGPCLRDTHWQNPFHTVGYWTGRHYRRAWLRDAGLAIELCPNAAHGESCPTRPRPSIDFAALDGAAPPSYGSFTVESSPPTTDDGGDCPLTSVLNPDATVHLPPAFGDLDEGETEDLELPGAASNDGEFQPIGDDDGYVAGTDGEGIPEPDIAGVARERGRSSIPTKDIYGYRTLVIVHTDGIHGIGVGFCRCQGSPSDNEQLIKYGGLYPVTPDVPSTAFTLQFLEYRHIDDVVCKTTPQAHMRKIRRATEPEDFRLAPNRYPELLLVDRQFSAIKNLIDFGFASQPLASWKAPPAGGLVWKCVVCPRKTPDFSNIPKAWESNPQEWRKFISLCYDGNFSGDHTISRNPGNNVPLYPGTGMFEHPDIVRAHSAKAVDDKDLRRIYPDLVCGVALEQWDYQDPVDKSLDSAFQQTITTHITRIQLLYDIWCRYGVHLKKRFKHSGLNWPEFREVLQGVGVWHLYGHVPECHRRFSPSYSPRSGIVDGEILETLWSLLNAVLQSCRGMSLAAREEKINIHMNDINYRKIVGMVGTLVRKYRKYSAELSIRHRHLARLELSCDPDDIQRWELARKELEEKRVKDPYYADTFWDSPAMPSVPSKITTEVHLLEDDEGGLVKAMIDSLRLEENGLRMQAQGKAWGTSLSDRRTAAIARTRFNNRRINANKRLNQLLGTHDADEAELLSPRLPKLLDEDEWGEDTDPQHGYDLRVQAEFKPVYLPSARDQTQLTRENLSNVERHALDIEIALRLGDMVDRLQEIREGLCDQAQSYRLEIRKKKGKGKANYRDRTNAWLHVRAQTKDVRVHAAIYNHHVRRLHRCFWDTGGEALARYKTLESQFKLIRPEDIRCSTATYDMYNDQRTRGEFKLPWFWRMEASGDIPELEAVTGDQSMDDDTFIGSCKSSNPSIHIL